jgi:hypothetical protein
MAQAAEVIALRGEGARHIRRYRGLVCPGGTSVSMPSTLSWKPWVRSSRLNAMLHGLDFRKLEPSMPFTFPFLNPTNLSNLC